MDSHQKAQLEKARSQKPAIRKFYRVLQRQKPARLDAAFREVHQEVFERQSCLSCAHCCQTVGPLFTPRDISRLASHFKLSEAAFQQKYLRRDEDGDLVLQSLPCPFLQDDKYCSVYPIRPKACREYPHTDRPRMHQVLSLTAKNSQHCPAVAEMTAQLRQKLG